MTPPAEVKTIVAVFILWQFFQEQKASSMLILIHVQYITLSSKTEVI